MRPLSFRTWLALGACVVLWLGLYVVERCGTGKGVDHA